MVNTPGNKARKQGRIIPPPGRKNLDQRPVALILGSADCLHADMAAALAMFKPVCIVGVNEAGRDHPGPLDHWVSMHPVKDHTSAGLVNWVKERRAKGYPDAGTLWRPRHRNCPDGVEMRDCPSWGGSSGLFAVGVCILALEYRCVLAGVPMQAERAHYNNPKVWSDCVHYLANWKTYLPQMRDKAKSMSGWTAELLGKPDPVWLGCHQPSSAA